MLEPLDWETQIQDAPELEPAVKLALASMSSEFPTLFEQLVAQVREMNAGEAVELTFERLHGWLHAMSWMTMRLKAYVTDEETQQTLYPLIAEIASLGIALHRGYRDEIEHADLFGQLDFDGG